MQQKIGSKYLKVLLKKSFIKILATGSDIGLMIGNGVCYRLSCDEEGKIYNVTVSCPTTAGKYNYEVCLCAC